MFTHTAMNSLENNHTLILIISNGEILHYCYQFYITNTAPGVSFTEIMDFDIVNFSSPYSEEQIKTDETKDHLYDNTRKPHVP